MLLCKQNTPKTSLVCSTKADLCNKCPGNHKEHTKLEKEKNKSKRRWNKIKHA